ncbi:leucine-rich repeat-containing G-protein coupled receptor 4-like [Oscarella lobularis]|uniref:leucine-rich repeat-containing G-protein coupled receptor 4-like n=1 Tax=Oscarella lobularis TaxID=121494 RepID=UPI00331404A3
MLGTLALALIFVVCDGATPCCRRFLADPTNVDCTRCNLTSVPSNLGPVTRLDLSDNFLRDLDGLKSYEDTLQHLDLHGNRLETLTHFRTMNFPNISLLKLEGNALRGGDIDVDFRGLSSLIDLDLSNNCFDVTRTAPTSTWPARLVRLVVRNACLTATTLERLVPVQSHSSLRALDASENGALREFDFLRKLRALTNLSLAETPATCGDLGTISGVTSLVQLDLRDALMGSGSTSSCSALLRLQSRLPSLRDLDLSGVNLNKLKQESLFRALGYLKRLSLRGVRIAPPDESDDTGDERSRREVAPYQRRLITHLNLADFPLEKLSYVMDFKDLEVLELKNVSLGRRFDLRALLSALPNIVELNLAENKLNELDSLKKLKFNLKRLDLSGTISSNPALWSQVDFESFEKLTSLSLARNGIETLNGSALRPSHLTFLNISDNPLRRIAVGAKFTALRVLDLSVSSSSQLSLLDDLSFLREMPRLRELYVSGQRGVNAQFISPSVVKLDMRKCRYFCGWQRFDSFSQFKSLREIDLEDNCVNDAILAHLSLGAVQKLSLSNNPNITTISPLKAPNFKRLRWLCVGEIPGLQGFEVLASLPYISHLYVDSIATGSRPLNLSFVMGHLRRLKVVSATRNGIAHLSDLFPSNVRWLRLREIRLDDNQLSAFSQNGSHDNETFPSLQYVSLAGNALAEVPSGAFAHFQHLHTLNLSNNLKLKRLGSNSIANLPNLMYLFLADDPIADPNPNNFYDTYNLRYVTATHCSFCCVALSHGKTSELPSGRPQSFQCNCSVDLAPTASCRRLIQYDTWMTTIAFESAVALLGNLLVIVWRLRAVMKHVRRNQTVTSTSLMILTLSVADFCMGCYLAIIIAGDQAFHHKYGLHASQWTVSAACQAAGFLVVFSTQLSVSVVLTIAVMSAFAKKLLTARTPNRFLRIVLVVEIVAASVVAAIPIILLHGNDLKMISAPWTGICTPLTLQQEFIYEYAFSLMSVYTLVAISGGALYLYFACQTLRNRKFSRARRLVASVAAPSVDDDRNRRAVRLLTLIAVTDIFCYLPTFIMLMVKPIIGDSVSYSATAYVTLLTLPLNAAANPILYTLSKRDFVNRFTDLKHCFRRKNYYYSLGGPSGTKYTSTSLDKFPTAEGETECLLSSTSDYGSE